MAQIELDLLRTFPGHIGSWEFVSPRQPNLIQSHRIRVSMFNYYVFFEWTHDRNLIILFSSTSFLIYNRFEHSWMIIYREIRLNTSRTINLLVISYQPVVQIISRLEYQTTLHFWHTVLNQRCAEVHLGCPRSGRHLAETRFQHIEI